MSAHPYDAADVPPLVDDPDAYLAERTSPGQEPRRHAGPAGSNGHPDGVTVVESLRAVMVPGGAFAFDDALTVAPLLGTREAPLWAPGEPLIITSSPGIGKTTLAQRLVLAQVGLRPPEVAGQPVQTVAGPVLYLAMDRPRQIARSLRRMVALEDRAVLDERVLVWKGPPPADVAKRPELLLTLATAAGAGVVYLDSLKDAALGLSSDEVGAAVNMAFQLLVSEGVDLAVLHHQIKRSPDGGKPSALADVYGSNWITAGAGSVVLLQGEQGVPQAHLIHLKPVTDPVGPLAITIHRATGEVTLSEENVDPLAWIQGHAGPVPGSMLADAYAAAEGVGAGPKHRERARRELDRLVRDGLAEVVSEGTRGGFGGSNPRTYRAAAIPGTVALWDA